jgi:formylglycine-generating enzyme required for sulfatase activity
MLTANLILTALLAADPLPETPELLSFSELKYLLPQSNSTTSPVVTPQLRQYLDRTVRIRGYILPVSMASEKQRQFILEPDNQHMHPTSANDANQMVHVLGKEDVSFTVKPLTIEGKLRHREHKDREGRVLLCLAMDDAQVVADDKPQAVLPLLKTFRDEFIEITPGKGKFPAEVAVGEGKTTKVTLGKPLHVAKYEVPQNLWEAVMGDNPSKWKGPRNSVEMLDFDDAQEFCAKVTRHLRAAKLIAENQVVRLPSEAEWEYCARAGTTTRFSFGDDIAKINEYAWHTGNAAGNDPPVGAKAPNPWGLYDVHGYLWEWCSDVWTDDVTKLPADGKPYRAEGDAAKIGVLRGGSWKDKPDDLASGHRRRADRSLADDAVGLRCVLAVEGDR